MRFEDLIDEYNNDRFEPYLKHFNNINVFYRMAQKKGLLDDIKYQTDHQDDFAYFLIKNTPKEYFQPIILSGFSDIVIEDGKIMWYGDSDSIYDMTCKGRNSSSRDFISEVMNGGFDLYYDLNEEYYDIIYYLNEKNKYELSSRIIEYIKTAHTETDLLEEIAEMQESEFATITEENIKSILKDEETINYLLSSYDDFGLMSLYNSAYQSAMTDAWQDDLLSEVGLFIGGEAHFDYGKEPVVSVNITEFSNRLNLIRPGSTSLYYNSEFSSFIRDEEGCMSLYFSEHPKDFERHINELFFDYLTR